MLAFPISLHWTSQCNYNIVRVHIWHLRLLFIFIYFCTILSFYILLSPSLHYSVRFIHSFIPYHIAYFARFVLCAIRNHTISFPPAHVQLSAYVVLYSMLLCHMHFMLAVVAGYIMKQKQRNQGFMWYSNTFKQYKFGQDMPACIFIFTAYIPKRPSA